MLEDPDIDAVHINTPIPDHARQTHRRASGGQACRLHGADGHDARGMPVGSSRPQRASGKNYMMMETVVYTREFLLREGAARERRAGPDPVPARGAHAGDGRLARLLGGPSADALRHPCREPAAGTGRRAGRARRVPRLGTDRLRSSTARYGSPFAVESAAHHAARLATVGGRGHPFPVRDGPRIRARASTCTANWRQFEWQQIEGERAVSCTSARSPSASRSPTSPTCCPGRSARFTTQGRLRRRRTQHLSFIQGGGHGGSHPHLVHEFVRSIVEGRRARDRRGHRGQLDQRRHLRPRVGHGRRTAGSRYPDYST